ncbi:hypothetical protein [Endozoicomonas sp. Mp262]|uniref:hypothetical protein n=1 Tax=Endozoicomonas sp. Mp262 TaxID=2919499 RepID=UPI0021DAA96A
MDTTGKEETIIIEPQVPERLDGKAHQEQQGVYEALQTLQVTVVQLQLLLRKARADIGEDRLYESMIADELFSDKSAEDSGNHYQDGSDNEREQMNYDARQAQYFFSQQGDELFLAFEEKDGSEVNNTDTAILSVQGIGKYILTLLQTHQQYIMMISCPLPDSGNNVSNSHSASVESNDEGEAGAQQQSRQPSEETCTISDNDGKKYVCTLVLSDSLEPLQCKICFGFSQNASCLVGCDEAHLGCRACLEQQMQTEVCHACGAVSDNNLKKIGEDVYCRTCDRKTEPHHCMTCRKVVTGIQKAPAAIRNLIDLLEAFCPYKEKGCQDIVKLQRMLSHIKNECAHREVFCTNQGCGEKMAFMLMQRHEKTCDYALKQCQYCQKEMLGRELFSHEVLCEKKPTQCPFCYNELMSDMAIQHVGECPDLPAGLEGAVGDILMFCVENKYRKKEPDEHSGCACSVLKEDNAKLLGQVQVLTGQVQILTGQVQDLFTYMRANEHSRNIEASPPATGTAAVDNQEVTTMIMDVADRLDHTTERLEQLELAQAGINSEIKMLTETVNTLLSMGVSARSASDTASHSGQAASVANQLSTSNIEKRLAVVEAENVKLMKNLSFVDISGEFSERIQELYDRVGNQASLGCDLRKEIDALRELLNSFLAAKEQKGFFSSFGKGKK